MSTMTDKNTTRATALETASSYLKRIDREVPHAKNIETHLRGPVLNLTLRGKVETKSETTSEGWDQKAYESLCRHDKARMEAFLSGLVLVVPHYSPPAKRPSSRQNSITESKGPKSAPILSSIQDLTLRRTRSTNCYPQIRASELTMRLDMYLKSLLREGGKEPPKLLKARAASIVRAFVATVGCVTSVQPTLMKHLQAVTREILCVETLSSQVETLIRRVILAYEHEVSFASLAFLSSPEESAEHRLAPLIFDYLHYLNQNYHTLAEDCQVEYQLSLILDSRVRRTFKTVEFQSIGHLLEMCERFKYELEHILVPPKEKQCDDISAMKQAIRDLQRELLTVNGHVLPPFKSRKELVQLLSETLNSRSLFRRKVKSHNAVAPIKSEKYDSDDHFMSSGNEADIDGQQHGKIKMRRGGPRTNPKQSFRLATVDVMTKRLLLASSRTGLGGDAYFIVRDLFGGEDVEVVPSPTQVPQGRLRAGSIEIVVRLSCVIIKCHSSFDVYPKSLVGDCEPLIQLHTTTTETINLQEVRASDGEDGTDNDDSDDGDESSKLVLQEKFTDKTGWHTVAIRPALYERVGVWNTPS